MRRFCEHGKIIRVRNMKSSIVTLVPIEFARCGVDIVINPEEDDAERFVHVNADANAPPAELSLLGYSTGR